MGPSNRGSSNVGYLRTENDFTFDGPIFVVPIFAATTITTFSDPISICEPPSSSRLRECLRFYVTGHGRITLCDRARNHVIVSNSVVV